MSYSLRFCYNSKGKGDLELLRNGEVVLKWFSRTGSINNAGVLVNACAPDTYQMTVAPIETDHIGMVVDGEGWWVPFFKDGKRLHVGLHPDGNKPGTEGCVATIGTSALPLMSYLTKAIIDQKVVEITIEAGGDK